MSNNVKLRLQIMKWLHLTDHDDRMELDRIIEEKTGKNCDIGVSQLSDDEIKEILRGIWLRKKKRKPIELVAVV